MKGLTKAMAGFAALVRTRPLRSIMLGVVLAMLGLIASHLLFGVS